MPGCCHVQKSPNWLVQERGRDGVSRREERERESERGLTPAKRRQHQKTKVPHSDVA